MIFHCKAAGAGYRSLLEGVECSIELLPLANISRGFSMLRRDLENLQWKATGKFSDRICRNHRETFFLTPPDSAYNMRQIVSRLRHEIWTETVSLTLLVKVLRILPFFEPGLLSANTGRRVTQWFLRCCLASCFNLFLAYRRQISYCAPNC